MVIWSKLVERETINFMIILHNKRKFINIIIMIKIRINNKIVNDSIFMKDLKNSDNSDIESVDELYIRIVIILHMTTISYRIYMIMTTD